jgi:lysosomal Pro-X carboxypeptidase
MNLRGSHEGVSKSLASPYSFSEQIPSLRENLSYEIRFYNNTMDHLAPSSSDPPKFPHRYLINDTYFGKISGHNLHSEDCPGPIFLYAGNEGDITNFWDSNGFMQYLAVTYGGLLLFPEERYYGQSIPSNKTMTYLGTQQVLEDYVELLEYVKTEYDALSCPTIAFGGSYGGTLAAFLRFAYPSSIQGALASSSELGYYDRAGWEPRGITEFTFSEIVAAQYDKTEGCLEAILDAAEWIDSLGKNRVYRSRILETFNFCDESALLPRPSSIFIYGLEGLPQQNYPYPVGQLPAWPVHAVCNNLLANTTIDLLQRAAQVTALSMGYLLDGTCFKTPLEGPGNVPGDGPGKGSWGYQSCTETLHTFSSRARNPHHLGLREYDFQSERSKLHRLCRELYQVQPNTEIIKSRYGGFDLARMTSNTIFSAGELDPWGGAALTENDGGSDARNRGVYFFAIANGAHHLDLRGWHVADPQDVSEIRRKEEGIIVGWIIDFFFSMSSTIESSQIPKSSHTW